MFPVEYEYLSDVTIQIDGYIKASKRHTRYPITKYSYKEDEGKWSEDVANFMQFDHAERIIFRGNGTVDG